MWQTIVVLLVVAVVLVYLVRHYAGVYRSESSACSGCSGCSMKETDPGSDFKRAESKGADGDAECCGEPDCLGSKSREA